VRPVLIWLLERLQHVLDFGAGVAIAGLILRRLGYRVRVTKEQLR
jgi:hypothetical protein